MTGTHEYTHDGKGLGRIYKFYFQNEDKEHFFSNWGKKVLLSVLNMTKYIANTAK